MMDGRYDRHMLEIFAEAGARADAGDPAPRRVLVVFAALSVALAFGFIVFG